MKIKIEFNDIELVYIYTSSDLFTGSINLQMPLDSADKPQNVEVKSFFMRRPC